MRNKKWVRLLAYVTGSVNQELLLHNEYLAAENRILRAKLPSRLRLNDPERATLSEIGKRLGRKALRTVACVAKPDTILAWYRRLVAEKFDASKRRQQVGRPPVSPEAEALAVRMARENTGWGYDRIVGALAHLGHRLSDQTVGNILRRHGIYPAPKRSQHTSWRDFIAAQANVLAGAGFFTVELLTWRGLVTYYVLFFIHLESRRVSRYHQTSEPSMDGTGRHQRNPEHRWLSSPIPLCSARSRHEILCVVSVLACGGRRDIHSASGQESESERLCRTLGSISQAGVSFEVDSVRRAPTVAGLGRILRSLSRRKKPSRQRQRQQTAFPRRRR